MTNRLYLVGFKLSLLVLFSSTLSAQDFHLFSPDGNLHLEVSIRENISWKLMHGQQIVISQNEIGLEYDQKVILDKSSFKDYKTAGVNTVIYPEVPYKFAEIKDHYKELMLQFENGLTLNFRAFDDGIAYRFEDNRAGDIIIGNETFNISFPEGTTVWYPEEISMYSHNERSYLVEPVSGIGENSFCSLPVKFLTPDSTRIVYTETSLHDYPNMFLQKNGTNTFTGIFPKYVLEAIPNANNGPDRNEIIAKEADFISKTQGPRKFPWRLFIVGGNDASLIESNLAYQLAAPSALANTFWIKPGKVAWDWYNANNIFGVDFKSGLNTETYKYYIDFASENQIEYVILDEGWTKSTTEILDSNPETDVKELISYGQAKGVGIILWVLWKPLDEDIAGILSLYKSWGAKGVKVDFMQRSDQAMVSSYEEIARKASELELLVDFHGNFKPAGLQRKYPNVLNFEGVKGNENNKWSKDITPVHNLTIPFIRMAAGPMDYTPGAMHNGGKNGFSIHFERPMSQGTRCHQIAMYVIYEAPLQMLCESPSTYKKEQKCVDFMVQIPTTWDETKVLEARIGEYLIIARRKGNDWFIGGMTDWTIRNFEIPLDFLKGKYDGTVIKDGINADRYPEDYKITYHKFSSGDKLSVQMMPGGGFAAILRAN